MKLIHLHEATQDYRDLLTEVATELGFNENNLSQRFLGATPEVIAAAIDLFRLHLDTDGSADINSRLTILNMAVTSLRKADFDSALEIMEFLEGTSYMALPGMTELEAALKLVANSRLNVLAINDVCRTTYFLLSQLNAIAITTHSPRYSVDDVKYRAAIARAALKKMGITPKDL
jgi:hypothetical protein